MSNSSFTNREYKKNQLRQRVISNDVLDQTASTTSDDELKESSDSSLRSIIRLGRSEAAAERYAAEAERRKRESEDTIHRAHRKVVRRRAIILIIVLALTGVAAGGLYWYNRFALLENTTVVWERQFEQSGSSFYGYTRFGDNILKYSRDGASYIDASGKDVWIQSYEMSTPIVAVNGNYAAIADQQGNSIYICDLNGCQGIATTVLPVSKITISAQGVVAAILEDQTSSHIYYYQRDGSELELYIRGLLGGETDDMNLRVGYALDIDLSPGGNMLMGSFFHIAGSQLKNRVVFYNFSEVGKNALNRMVGGFDEIYEGSMVARVAYLNSTHAVAFADNSLSFYNLRDEMSPALARLVPVEEDILSVFYNENYAGIIVAAMNGDNIYRMDVYRSNGDLAFSKGFDFDYTNVTADDDMIFLYNSDSCQIYNRYGNLKYDGSFGYEIACITKGRLPNQIIVTGPSVMQEFMLH